MPAAAPQPSPSEAATGDLVVLCVRTAGLGPERGAAALRALHSAGRLTDDLLDAYLEELS